MERDNQIALILLLFVLFIWAEGQTAVLQQSERLSRQGLTIYEPEPDWSCLLPSCAPDDLPNSLSYPVRTITTQSGIEATTTSTTTLPYV